MEEGKTHMNMHFFLKVVALYLLMLWLINTKLGFLQYLNIEFHKWLTNGLLGLEFQTETPLLVLMFWIFYPSWIEQLGCSGFFFQLTENDYWTKKTLQLCKPSNNSCLVIHVPSIGSVYLEDYKSQATSFAVWSATATA